MIDLCFEIVINADRNEKKIKENSRPNKLLFSTEQPHSTLSSVFPELGLCFTPQHISRVRSSVESLSAEEQTLPLLLISSEIAR